MTIDTDDLTAKINQWLGINSQDRMTLTEQTKTLNDTLDMIQTRTAELETAVLDASTTVDNEKIKEELKQIDRDILYAQKISEGDELRRRYDRSGAMKLYQEAIALYPKDATIAYERLGYCYFQEKDYARAIDAYTKVIQMDPNYAVPYLGRGRIYFDMQEYRKAAADFEKAIELAPKSEKAYELLYKSYLKFGDIYSAIVCCDKAVAQNFGIRNYKYVAEALRSIRYCTRIIDSGQATAEDYYLRGKAYHDLGNYGLFGIRSYEQFTQYERAIQDFNKVVKLNPNYAEAYKWRGLCYSDMEQYGKAIQDYEKIIELKPNDATAYEDCAEFCRVYLKEHQRAITYYEKELKLRKDPYYTRLCYSRIGECYEKLGDKKNSIKTYATASKDERLNEKDRAKFKEDLERLKKSK